MIKKFTFIQCCFFLLVFSFSKNVYSQSTKAIPPRHEITLPEAHIGNLEKDTKILDSYEILPENIRQFYLDARSVFTENRNADFTNDSILKAAKKHNITLMGGPILGDLKEDGVTVWLRPATSDPFVVKVKSPHHNDEKSYSKHSVEAGAEQRIAVDGLSPDTEYKYAVYTENQKITEGTFRTAPPIDEKSVFRVAFGSCSHKKGLHNPNLIHQILHRQPHAMLLLGDIAVDDRDDKINMHRSDYLLRDVSKPWRKLSANIPIYASWDDHDYLNNDLGGIPEGFTTDDQEALREVWHQNWNNPQNNREGIYFNTRIGPAELIMLDTRSFRKVEERGEYGSYLGTEQLEWFKGVLKNSAAPFKIISSGTMWSDYVSNGKDSWGTWDTAAREEIFSLIEAEKIPGVLLISGDRHGARGFSIPKSPKFRFYEFEAASLGGVPGPDAMADDTTNQIFGYHGTDATAFGEFTFDTTEDEPLVVFRLIDQFGNILEEYDLSYSQLKP